MADHHSSETRNRLQVSLDEVLITDELARRPARPPDYESENEALGALAQAMTETPGRILQKLVDTVLKLCHADSAGISIVERGGAAGVFRWRAVAGSYAPNINGTMPRDDSPCGTVLDRNSVLLFAQPERHFVDLASVNPPIVEALLVPFHAAGKPVGTLWALAHTSQRKFDAEDARLLTSLSRFASAAYHMISTLKAVESSRTEVEQVGQERLRYRTLLESIDKGFCIIEMLFDASGKPLDYRFLEVNPAFEEQTGLANAAGQWMRQLRPEHEEHWFEIYGRVAVTGQSVRFENCAEALQRWFDVYAFRIGQPENRWVAILFTDITERKRAEDELRESEERFRTMADSSPFIIWVTDPAGNLQFMNRAYLEFLGANRISAAEFDWTQIIHPDDRDGCVAAFNTALRERRPYHVRVRAKRSDSQWRWFESRGNPLLNAAGRITGYIGSSSDITDIYESQEALRQAHRRKDEFIANMSHEIRSPLSGIMGYADILLAELQDPDHIEHINTIKESGKYLLEIINDILDLSKIESGKLKLNKECMSPFELLSDIHALMEVRAKEKSLRLVLSYDGALPEMIEADRTRLRQILINLIANGIKFTDQGSVQVTSRFRPELSCLEFEVTDTGIGIAPHMRAQLFEPFAQADMAATREYGGTGLGLAITKRLVDMMEGSISCESEPNKGTTFRVALPIIAVKPGNALIAARGGRPITPNQDKRLNCRVLIVDDRPEMQYLFRHFVEEAGGRVMTAQDGHSAIEAVRAAQSGGQSVDVVLMDIHMPGLDGYETVRRLRAQGFGKPIIALTAAAMTSDRQKCLAAGCDDYLTKPVEAQVLIDVVAHYSANAL